MKDEARLHERTAGRRTFAKYPIGKTIVMSKHTATETKGEKKLSNGSVYLVMSQDVR